MTTSVKTITQLESSDVKNKNAPSSKNISTSNLVDNKKEHYSFFKKSYKVQENVLNFSEIDFNPNRFMQASPTQVSWKTSKLFSRTLPTIEVNKSTKGKESSNSSSSDAGTFSTPFVKNLSTPSIIINKLDNISAPNDKSKSSKAASDWKSLKNKLIFLRKKGDISSEVSQTQTSDCKVNENVSKFRQIANQVINNKQQEKKSKSQMEGIVCKKEDLIHLLTEASKGSAKPISNCSNKNFNSASIQQDQLGLKAELSKEEEPKLKIKKSVLKKNNLTDPCLIEDNSILLVDEKLSDDLNQCKIFTQENIESLSGKDSKNVEPKQAIEKLEESLKKDSNIDYLFEKKDNQDHDQSEKKGEIVDEFNKNSSVVNSASVKWDDSNFVDAMILGDAIEAFLKEMRANPNEKKVSFKKN